MKLGIPESPVKRMAVTVGAAVAIMVAGGLIYLVVSGETPPPKIDGVKIVAAAHAYTRQMIANKQAVPKTVSLNELLTRGFLRPEDVAPFQGLEAEMVLTAPASSARAVVMRVHMPDGTDLLLFNDGTAQQAAR